MTEGRWRWLGRPVEQLRLRTAKLDAATAAIADATAALGHAEALTVAIAEARGLGELINEVGARRAIDKFRRGAMGDRFGRGARRGSGVVARDAVGVRRRL